MAVVARLLRGKPLDVVAREANVSVAKLTEWRERALAGAASALKERERDDREDEIARLKSKVGEITMDNEFAVGQDRRHGGQKPFGPKEVETMSQTVSPSTSRSYGLARVSRAWSVSRAGVYRFLKRTTSPAIIRRRGPTGPCRDADLADHIRREIEASDFHGEGYRKLWARLRVAGVRSSPRRVRRVMGENGLLAPHRVGRNQQKTHDGTIVTDKVNEMWGTDISHNRHPRGRAGLCFRRRRTRELRNRRHSRRPFSQSLRGARAGPAGGASVLRRHHALRGAWAQAASRSWLQFHVQRYSRTRLNVWASKLRRPSCANPRAMASPSASSEP